MKCNQILLLVSYIALTGACKPGKQTVGNLTPPIPIKEARSDKGIVVTANPLASEVGVQILEKGGNAIDAAIAVMFALSVVYPEAGNIGGGGFLIYRDKDGKSFALDFREKAPTTASQQYYLDKHGAVIDSAIQEGIFSIGVPGTVDGLFQMFDKFSLLKNIITLMNPAIQLAEQGFAISKTEAIQLNELQSKFKSYNKRPVAFVKETAWKEGDILKQTELANTLKRISINGRDEFYKGQTSGYIINTMHAHAKTWITKDDLSQYHSVWRDPIEFNYKDYLIISMPPPSSGGIHLAQLFGMYQLTDSSNLKLHSPNHIQLFTEFERRVYADRAIFLGDPDFHKTPLGSLLSFAYLKSRIADINLKKASDSKTFIERNEMISETEETTHLSIIDKDGNAVSITTTLNGGYGSFVVVEGGGFLLNNEMDDFSIKPGVPNLYGLIGSKANAIAPNKRMLSSMTPTIVAKDNQVEYILGSPGGSTIITTVFQVLMNLIEFKLTPSDAVQSKRFHHQLVPDCIYFEEGNWDKSVMSELETKNYKIQMRGPIGRVELIARDGNSYIGVADQRGDDSVGIRNK